MPFSSAVTVASLPPEIEYVKSSSKVSISLPTNVVNAESSSSKLTASTAASVGA